MPGRWARSAFVLATSILLAPSTAVAQQTFSVLIDSDGNAATGCTATLASEQFTGADYALVTTVDVTVDPPSVTDLALFDCATPPEGWVPNAGPDPFTLNPQPPWPAPPAGGLDAIETYLPLSAITFGGGPLRLGFLSGPLEEPQDVLFTTGGAAPGPILLGLPISVIPTLAEWSMLLLALLLLASGMAVLRRRASRAGAFLGVLLLTAGLGAALAAFPHSADGNLADWTGHTPAAIDALGDAPVNADIGQAFAHVEGSTLFFRIDADCAADAAPVAVDDAYTTDEDNPLTVPAPGVLGNDSDPNGDPLTASLDTGPAVGTLVFSSDGSFTYNPPLGFVGEVSFTYHATDDDSNDSNIATVTITVEPNAPPVAVDDAYTTDGDNPLTVPAPGVLGNDSDPDGDPLTASLDTGPAAGTLVFSSDGSFTYAPNASFSGEDSFTYHANDGTDDSNVATVTITNDSPVAVDDAYVVPPEGGLVVGPPGVLDNDSDPEGDTLSAVLDTGPAHGTLVFSSDGSFAYSPGASFSGEDSFTYHANDGVSDSNVVTVTLTNDPPVAVDDAYTTDQDTPLTIPAPGVLDNDSDPEGDTLSASLDTGPAHGTLIFNSDGAFTYNPDASFSGEDSFTYHANDGISDSNVATVTITVDPVGSPP